MNLQPFMQKAKVLKAKKDVLYKDYYDEGVMERQTIIDIATDLYNEHQARTQLIKRS